MSRILFSVFCLFFAAFAGSVVLAEEPEPTLYLEFFWLSGSEPREALMIAPPRKVPLVLVRVLSKDGKPESIAAARGTLTQSTENSDELLLACSEPRTLWGKADAEEVVPRNFLFMGEEYGAVDLGVKLTTCLVKPVLVDQEEEIIKKYLPPEK